MKTRFFSLVLGLTLGLGIFSCQKQEDPKPANPGTPNVPFRIAKTKGRMATMGTLKANDGFTSYIITTSEGYSYTLTFQEVNGYTYLTVTNPGGSSPSVSGDCIERIIAVLEKWINDSQFLAFEDDPCGLASSFVNDFRSLRDCVPAEAQEDFDEALDEIDEAVDEYCD
jgi:hypothetical protein